jgi:hypothetical protein
VDHAITEGSWCDNIAYYNLVEEKGRSVFIGVVPQDKKAAFDEKGLTQALQRLLGTQAEIEIQPRERLCPLFPQGAIGCVTRKQSMICKDWFGLRAKNEFCRSGIKQSTRR